MRSVQTASDKRIVTLGELCEAIAEEELPATLEDEFYLVRRSDLKRFMQASSQDRVPAVIEQLLREPAQVAS